MYGRGTVGGAELARGTSLAGNNSIIDKNNRSFYGIEREIPTQR